MEVHRRCVHLLLFLLFLRRLMAFLRQLLVGCTYLCGLRCYWDMDMVRVCACVCAAFNRSQLPEVAERLPKLMPAFDDIVVNSGLWHLTPFDTDVATAKQQIAGFKVKDPSRKPIWMTSTFKRNPPSGEGVRADQGFGTQAAYELGWDIVDRYGACQWYCLRVAH